MKKCIIAAAMGLWVVCLAAAASADTLVLRDGTRVQGTLTAFAARTITFRHTNGVARRYATSRVQLVEFVSDERVNPEATISREFAAPAGTELVVRTVKAIDSREARTDQTFAAIVEQDVTDSAGRVIVPVNSKAYLTVRQMSSGGATSSPEMVLDVDSIAVDGRRYIVSTTDVAFDSNTGIGKNKRTAEAVGGGAALGSIIGAIAGGGKGAAIGVLVGAAGGAGAQVLTRGRDVRVPAETVLRFRLDRPVTFLLER